MFFLLSLLLTLPASAQDYQMQANESVKRQLNFDLAELNMVMKKPAKAKRYQWEPLLPLEPNSAVASVTVFTDRALVTRVLRATPDEDGQILFVGLPLAMIDSSVQASVERGDGKVVGVELVAGSGDKGDDRAAKIKEEMRPLATELGQIQDQIEALLAQKAYLRGTLLTTERTRAPTVQEVRGMFSFVGETERAIAEGLRTQEDRAKILGQKLEPFLARLGDTYAAGRQVRVALSTGQTEPVTVALRYQVRGAGWTPAYNARYLPDSGKVQLEMFGLVHQRTHESWEETTLSLSTANPTTSAALPQLRPWILDGAAHRMPSARGRLMAGMESKVMGKVDSAAVLAPTASSSAGPVVFQVSGKRTIRGDGSEQRIPLGSQQYKTTTEYLAVPKLVPEVYRTGTVHYQGNVPLLAGQISAYVDADYVGSSHLSTTLPGESFQVAFGTHDRIKIQRLLVERKQVRSGRKDKYTFHFRTKLKNLGDKPETVELVDQVPVAQSSDVSVKLLDMTDGHTTKDDDAPGTHRWKIDLAPGEEKTIDIAFAVWAPRGKAPHELRQMMQ
jgi:uncharacterized protein (TIGR02231 family)